MRLVVCLGLISGLLLSYNLWINDRFFPLTPVTDFIPILSPPFDQLLLITVLILLVIIIFYPKSYIYGVFFTLAFYLALQDQTRLQPWFYQYIFLLGAIAWFDHKQVKNRFISPITICQTILIGIYIWSGLHKLNYTYIFETFEWLSEPALQIFPISTSLSLLILAIITSLIEAAAGLSLAFQSTQKYAVGILITMHIFILMMIGPSGLAYNSIVWPWNICFILLLLLLFAGTKLKPAAHRNLYLNIFIMA